MAPPVGVELRSDARSKLFGPRLEPPALAELWHLDHLDRRVHPGCLLIEREAVYCAVLSSTTADDVAVSAVLSIAQ